MTSQIDNAALAFETSDSGILDPDARSLRALRKWPCEPGIAGVDEAGCGPLAGPVVVAAVILDPVRRINGLDDSKLLPEATREKLYKRIIERAVAWSVIAIEVGEIDRINIYHARMAGMLRAVIALSSRPAFALIDGNRLPRQLPCRARAIVDGDALIPSISAASIVAKVTRDRIMRELDARWPGYGFARHKGYSVPEHLDALQRLGPCPQHRRSFAPVRELCGEPATLPLPVIAEAV
ncbi:MAG TPA: ribonuclease HII [Rhodanobacteraceae bacterium]|nr:ribonuclease HII [Rhodanobacteraceae bacterium]